MKINADFGSRAAVHASRSPWRPSPIPGVERRMLDRIGDEVARATTIVRYAPGSRFSPHVHSGGEEIFVLEGVFSDEHGDFPAGSYIRNPPQTSHAPGSRPGCTIFVKLWQFDPADRTQIRLNTKKMEFTRASPGASLETMPLFNDRIEDVSLERWSAGVSVDLVSVDGMEILVLDGTFEESDEKFTPQSWLRLPKHAQSTAFTGPSGARVWIKRNHLGTPPGAPDP